MGLNQKLNTSNFLQTSQKGAVNGVASLDGTGKVPSGQLPSTGGWSLIQTITPSSGVTTASFTSIPQTYKHLFVFIKGMATTTNASNYITLNLTMNGITTSTYNYSNIAGASGAVSAGGNYNFTYIGLGEFPTSYNGNTYAGENVCKFYNYTDANQKFVESDNEFYYVSSGATATAIYYSHARGSNTGLVSGINQLTFTASSSGTLQGMTFELFGVN